MHPLISAQGDLPDYLIVGLGNHGEKYKNTRQNIGFEAVDFFLKSSSVNSTNNKKRHWAIMNKCLFEGQVVFFVKPQMFMDNSGMPVDDIMTEYRVRPEQLIVIHDDVNLKCGCVKASFSDETCEHRGVKSIINHIGSSNFLRVKIGVGKKPYDMTDSEFLLSKFSDEEIRRVMEKIASLHEFFTFNFYYGIEKAAKLLNN